MTCNVDGVFRGLGHCENILKTPSKHKEGKCRRKLNSRVSVYDNLSRGPLKAYQQYMHWSVADRDCHSFHGLDNRGISAELSLSLSLCN